MDAESGHETARSPNGRWVVTGPFTSIHDRDELFDDLDQATDRQARPSVFAVFGFRQLKERLETMLEPDGNVLLGRVAGQLAASAGAAATLYESRRGEFCGLFDGNTRELTPLLEAIRSDLDREFGADGIEVAVGVVELPAEAGDPISALRLADERRGERAGQLRPTPRRSVYARITAAVQASKRADESLEAIGAASERPPSAG